MNWTARIKLFATIAFVLVGLLLASMERHYRFHPESGPSVLSVETLIATVKSDWWIWVLVGGSMIVATIIDILKYRRGELDDDR